MDFSFDSLFTGLYNIFIDFVQYCIDWIFQFVDGLFMPAVSALPDLNWNLGSWFELMAFANTFVAIDYGLSLCAAYFAFVSVVLLVKWILALIPGMT